jgi:hypothetical protein
VNDFVEDVRRRVRKIADETGVSEEEVLRVIAAQLPEPRRSELLAALDGRLTSSDGSR